jgi:hypothetical protein
MGHPLSSYNNDDSLTTMIPHTHHSHLLSIGFLTHPDFTPLLSAEFCGYAINLFAEVKLIKMLVSCYEYLMVFISRMVQQLIT